MQEQEQIRPHRRPHNWSRRVALAITGLLALWLLAWLAVPPLLKSQAEQRLSALLGRQVRVGAVEFAPWAMSLTVRDFSIAGAGDGNGPEQLRIRRLHADVSASSLWRRAPVIEALQVEAPALRLTRLPGGGLDIDDMLARLRPPADAPPSEPARFAVYNLQLTDGRVHVDDLPAGLQHEVQALQLGLPFISNLPAHVAVTVEPRLAFQLNGSAFDTGAQVLPFGQARQGQLQLRLDELDLARWAAYLPATVPLRPSAGLLSANLTAEFSVAGDQQPKLVLRGQATLRDVELLQAPGAEPSIGWKRLQVALDDVQPLARRVALGEIRLEGLSVAVARDAQGQIDLLKPPAGSAPKPAAPPEAPAPLPAPWQLSFQAFELSDAALRWQDGQVAPPARLELAALNLSAGPWRSTDAALVPVKWSGRLGQGATGGAQASITGEGSAGPSAASLAVEMQDFDVDWMAPYVAQQLALPLAGRAGFKGRLDWASGDQPRLAADIGSLRLANLRLGAAKAGGAPLSWRSVAITDGRIDLLARTARIGLLTIEQPQVDLQRAADGRLSPLDWLRPASAAATPSTPAPPPPTPWQVELQALQVGGGQLRWADAQPASPVALRLVELQLSATALRWPPAAGKPVPAQVTLSARVWDGRPPVEGRGPAPAGRVEWKGQAVPEPLAARGLLRVERLPVHAVAPYVESGLQLVLAHADAGWRGDVALQQRPSGFEYSADGDALLTDVQVQSVPAEAGAQPEELLNWQSLKITALKLRGQPGAPASVDIGEAALSDFYSRLVITEQGRFNLRDVRGGAKPAAGAASQPAAPAASVEAAKAADPAAPVIAVRQTRLARGRIDFTDRFIKPNYSAALSELNGTLGAFSTGSPDKAALSLQGRVAGTGLLDISGELNPLARPLALDIRAKATDIELAPFSPYSGRYAGYAIERGKLSMDVGYKIEPDGRLDATHRIVLNQLTFGDRVESPDATKLPVTLAIALLKDRNGVIDLDLPVTGSLNEPQFSVFGLVWKILGNLLVKAVTAPFSLLSGGGGQDISTVEFMPGTDRLAPSGEASLSKVAQALADRPILNLTVSGASDAPAETEAIRATMLEARLLAEHQRRAGLGATPAAPPTVAEREALLRRVYADTRLPDKPRNLVGLAKELPPAEMEERLKAAMPVDDDAVRDLAMRRGTAVRDALLGKGLSSERLFLAAPKWRAAGAAADAGNPPKPGAQLVLSTR